MFGLKTPWLPIIVIHINLVSELLGFKSLVQFILCSIQLQLLGKVQWLCSFTWYSVTVTVTLTLLRAVKFIILNTNSGEILQ